jgi:photosystem II stability/assembly factor-like uncharacterized protein
MQDSGTSAGLRGIHAVSESVAWASGTDGTVLRTLDGGSHWVKCAVPPGREKLDFRGVMAWDATTALVMASGPGELSRLYRTTDGCKSWTEVARNHAKDGFWDAIVFHPSPNMPGGGPGLLLGDPVGGRFETDGIPVDATKLFPENACMAKDGEGAFAASNTSAVMFDNGDALIGTGGKSGARVLRWSPPCLDRCPGKCNAVSAPMAGGTDAAGIFSMAFRSWYHGIAVGGDYKKPEDSAGTAAWTDDGGYHWIAAKVPPHGYRSAVAWDPTSKSWIAVGTNGSDVSLDDGHTWERLDDGNWNAISLPFVVGPDGRIGRLSPSPTRIE